MRQGRKSRVGSTSYVDPSPYYIGFWPMTQLNASGTYDSITLTNSSVVDATNDTYSGVSSATWLIAGTPIRIRPTGTIPGGLSASTQYYAGKPDSDTLTLHLTEADAIAGTNKVDITSQGSAGSTSIIYPSYVRDDSGQDNHLLFGTSVNDQTVWSDIGVHSYMCSGTSGSVPAYLGRLPAASWTHRWSWPEYSMYVSAHMMCNADPSDSSKVINDGRALLGCGGSGSGEGPRLQTGVSSPVANTPMVMIYNGGASFVSSSGTAESYVVEDQPYHIAFWWDAYNQHCHTFINGRLDHIAQYRNVSAMESCTPSADFCVGGVSSPNCQGWAFRDVHVLSIPASKRTSLQVIRDLVHMQAASPYYRIQDGDL